MCTPSYLESATTNYKIKDLCYNYCSFVPLQTPRQYAKVCSNISVNSDMTTWSEWSFEGNNVDPIDACYHVEILIKLVAIESASPVEFHFVYVSGKPSRVVYSAPRRAGTLLICNARNTPYSLRISWGRLRCTFIRPQKKIIGFNV